MYMLLTTTYTKGNTHSSFSSSAFTAMQNEYFWDGDELSSSYLFIDHVTFLLVQCPADFPFPDWLFRVLVNFMYNWSTTCHRTWMQISANDIPCWCHCHRTWMQIFVYFLQMTHTVDVTDDESSLSHTPKLPKMHALQRSENLNKTTIQRISCQYKVSTH